MADKVWECSKCGELIGQEGSYHSLMEFGSIGHRRRVKVWWWDCVRCGSRNVNQMVRGIAASSLARGGSGLGSRTVIVRKLKKAA